MTTRTAAIVLTSLSLTGLGIASCTAQRNFEPKAQKTQSSAQVQTAPTSRIMPQASPEVPYVPTPNQVVEGMLQLAQVDEEDILYDLGSGDGRIPIAAAEQFNIQRGVGVELRPDLIEKSQQKAQEAGVSNRVEFLQQDLFATDLSAATVVTLYLLPEVNLKLRSKLFQELRPGTRVVSHDFDMGDWEPERVIQVQGPVRRHTLYYWIIPNQIPKNLQ